MKFEFEVGKEYCLENVILHMGMGLGDINAIYLETYIGAGSEKRLIHNFGKRRSKDSYDVYKIWDENIDSVVKGVVTRLGRYSHNKRSPETDFSEGLKNLRLKNLKILQEAQTE